MAILGRQGTGQLGITLIVQDVAAAADFYRDVLGAEEVHRSHRPHPGAVPDAKPVSAELRLGGAYLTVTRENPRWREAPRPDWPRSPFSAGAASAFMTVYVDDVDAVFAKALAAGASPTIEGGAPEDAFWGDRMVQFHDPAGHVWRVLTRLEDVEVSDLPARYTAARAVHGASKGPN
ncbi:VOC family protein [Siccirubricoccus sp. KC 17139]|uniref:VOC family protein n=1 Tax=Siccirubricoccus soli TaxID=2899147 RepID=A0ABT1DCY9_9PROT|nr:VOC family protein [Siccirubricoccus soli]MCO6419779.1 VOC family protein [Siccirubricoccus soli]MCP2685914.1 VOC family protein [Siccirubricoccus soli]